MNSYLVTGAAGFIGSSFVRQLLGRNEKIVVLDALTYSGRRESLAEVEADPNLEFVHGDICDAALVSSLIETHRPKAVINFAAESHVDRSIESAAEFVRTNVAGAHVLLQASLDYWRGLSTDDGEAFRFLQVSTDEVYGSVEEGEAHEGAPFNPSSPYSASKASADMMTRAYYYTHGLPVLITHGCNTYGPRQFPEKFIPLLILRALSKMSLPIYGRGTNVREWIHVEDHAEGILTTLDQGMPGKAYNLGSRYRVSNLEVVSELCPILRELVPSSDIEDYSDLIEYVEDRPGHDLRYALDSSRANKDLGWRPRIEFQQGLASTIEWYVGNSEWWQPITDGQYQLGRIGLLEEA
jgi:dTDP-glucose 4,6-dehydratase